MEPHETHSLVWCWGARKPKTITCNKAGTVEDVLKLSQMFRKIAKENKDKELVIVRNRKAISSHFPCCLIGQETLTVRYVKAVGKVKQLASGSRLPKGRGPPGKLVMFHVLTHGGKKVVRIMRNPALKNDIQIHEITVFAYEGETVKEALKRDGRLSNIIFKKNCGLSCKSTDMELSNIVDKLDGETVQIVVLSRSSPPESQPGSLDDYMVQNDSQRSDPDENQDPPQQSTTNESVNDSTLKQKPKLNGDMATMKIIHEITDSEPMQRQLSKQVRDVLNRMRNQRLPRRSRVQNLFHVEYGKSAQSCLEMKTIKKLGQLGDSVCQVKIKGSPRGSGFLLFDKFVLTNGHVVKDIYKESSGQLEKKVTVHFALDQMEDKQESGAEVVVEEIVGGEYCRDVSGYMCDWALLRLGADQTLPDGLLASFGFLPQCGGICIIGYPGGTVKKCDPCFIIPSDNRSQIVERHRHENPEGVVGAYLDYNESPENIQLVTPNFFTDVKETLKYNRQNISYESCFSFGSSGSPVFDKDCNVVAMHTGGFNYRNARGESHSVIEYGHPLSIIIERIIIQIVEEERLGVLKKYLACFNPQHQHVMTNLKKLVESRNLTTFKNAVNNSVVADDERLKEFFEFFSQAEEPVPMDTESN